jgi:threonine aldolase
MTRMRSFGSDNHAPVHPDVLAAIVAANVGDHVAYGDDPFTAAAEDLFRQHFGPQAQAYLVFNGTAANVLSLQAVLRPYQAVICSAAAHISTDECGAPERFLGSKLIGVPTADAKLTVDAIDAVASGWGDQHHVQPRAVSITQSTELGTRYSLDEVAAIADWVHAHDMVLHVDGARLANAAAGLGVDLAAASTGCGVDVLSFGGTKNGGMGAEAVVVLRPGLADDFRFLRKQAMQLASKMRYAAAQFTALLTDDLWRRNAGHANRLAQRLAAAVADVDGIRVTQPVQANAVFAIVPPAAVPVLQAEYPFYVWNERTSEVRWMTSFETSEDDVDGFAAAIRRVLGGLAPADRATAELSGAVHFGRR